MWWKLIVLVPSPIDNLTAGSQATYSWNYFCITLPTIRWHGKGEVQGLQGSSFNEKGSSFPVLGSIRRCYNLRFLGGAIQALPSSKSKLADLMAKSSHYAPRRLSLVGAMGKGKFNGYESKGFAKGKGGGQKGHSAKGTSENTDASKILRVLPSQYLESKDRYGGSTSCGSCTSCEQLKGTLLIIT